MSILETAALLSHHYLPLTHLQQEDLSPSATANRIGSRCNVHVPVSKIMNLLHSNVDIVEGVGKG